MNRVGIIGTGRLGTGLALALEQAGRAARLHGRVERELPAGLRASWGGGAPAWIPEVDVVVLAIPDDSVNSAARSLAASGPFDETHSVLHLSGLLEVSELLPFKDRGCAIGSLHPLQSLSDPRTAPARLRGAAAVLDGDEKAMAAAAEIAAAVGLECVRLPSGARTAYHAAAVFASNYVVVLAVIAKRLMESVGVPGHVAWRGLRSLLHGTAENLMNEEDPDAALTGPVVRGDAQSVRRHIAALPDAHGDLYRMLARAALEHSKLTEAEKAAVEEALSKADG